VALRSRVLAAVAAGLPVYTGYVPQAQTQFLLGYRLTAGSLMQVAPEVMHLTLLPAAQASYARKNAALTAASVQATGLLWIVVVLVLAIVLAFVLYRVQRWLSRSTHRVFNIGMLAAAGSSSGAGAHWAAVAGRALQSWYTVIGQACALDNRAQYTAETALVIGPGANASTAGFAWVEADPSNAINADDAVFHSNATAGRDAFTGLGVVIVLAAALMAAGCAWGLSRRLAEYR
jgi:hypothetical protein